MKKVQFTIRVLLGGREISVIAGLPKPSEFVTVQDLQRVPDMEQFLERLTGLRFHINAHEDRDA